MVSRKEKLADFSVQENRLPACNFSDYNFESEVSITDPNVGTV